MPTRWERVYSVSMAFGPAYKREGILERVAAGEIIDGADLQGVDLSGANLRGASYDANTKWPEGVDPQAAGAVMVDD